MVLGVLGSVGFFTLKTYVNMGDFLSNYIHLRTNDLLLGLSRSAKFIVICQISLQSSIEYLYLRQ